MLRLVMVDCVQSAGLRVRLSGQVGFAKRGMVAMARVEGKRREVFRRAARAGLEPLEQRVLLSDSMFAPQVAYVQGSDPESVVAADFNNDGNVDLAAVSSFAWVTIAMGQGDGSFAKKGIYEVGPTNLVVGDFNGDGNLDLVGGTCLLLGRGDGTFSVQYPISVTLNSGAMGAGDFNGDGKLDLAVAFEPSRQDGSGGDLAVFLGGGDGTFAPYVDYKVGDDPTSIITGNFDHDVCTDLAVATDKGGEVLFGNADGTLSHGATYLGISPTVCGDFNRDGNLDLVGPGKIMLGNGDGTFTLRGAFGGQELALGAGDFDRDGNLDLVVSGEGVGVLLGNGDGTFGVTTTHAMDSAGCGCACVADFDNDGRSDIAAGFSSDSGVSVLLNRYSGTPLPSVNAVVTTPSSVQSHDVTIAYTLENINSDLCNVAIQYSMDDGTTWQFATERLTGSSDGLSELESSPGGVSHIFVWDSAADMHQAGYEYVEVRVTPGNDAVGIAGTTGQFAVHNYDVFSPGRGYAAGPGPYQVTAGDFNNDGKVDVAVLDGGDNFNDTNRGVRLLTGDGRGAFAVGSSRSTGFGDNGTAIGDFNRDGYCEIVKAAGDFNRDGLMDVVEYSAGNVNILLNNGDGTFTSECIASSGTDVVSGVVVGDFNSDGNLDVAATENWHSQYSSDLFSGTLIMMFGDGSGVFVKKVEDDAYVGLEPAGIVVSDFNNDGILDLSVADGYSMYENITHVYKDCDVNILLGEGDGTFRAGGRLLAGLQCSGIAAGDVNADGKPDLVVTNWGSDTGCVFLGLGDGTFSDRLDFYTGENCKDVTIGDFNGDGAPDVATIAGGRVHLLYNELANDTVPPTPNPTSWATVPYATSATSIRMVADAATDRNGVQYRFKCLTAGGHSSNWLDSPVYEDTGLTPGVSYSYTVRARDMSSKYNMGAWTVSKSALAAGPWVVSGTEGDDSIHLSQSNSAMTIVVNGGSSTAATTAVTSITITGLDGNDQLMVDESVTMGVTINGGAGNDTITGGSGADIIDGGPGADQIFGGGGNDTLLGGGGADVISGNGGSDLILGGGGADTMYGNSGNDTLLGGAGADVMFGQAGNDSLNGGAGNDAIYGAAGVDTIVGGPGNDLVYSGGGNDFVYVNEGATSSFRDSVFTGTGMDQVARDPADSIVGTYVDLLV